MALQRLRHLAGCLNIGGGRSGVARGVVVHQHDGAGVQLQRPARYFTRIDWGMIDRTLALGLAGDDRVLAVEEQQMQAFRAADGRD